MPIPECQKCGTALDMGGEYCHACGARIPQEQASLPAPQRLRLSLKWLSAAALGALLLLALAFIRPVPELSGTPEEVTSLAKSKGFSSIELRYEAAERPIGRVLGQFPEAGSYRPTWTRIIVSVAGPRPVRMPDVRGMPMDEAKSKLAKVGLSNVTISEQHDESIGYGGTVANSVQGQSPKADEIANDGIGVVLQVAVPPTSDGPYVPSTQSLEYKAIDGIFQRSDQTKILAVVSDGREALVLTAPFWEWAVQGSGAEVHLLRKIDDVPYWEVAESPRNDGEGGGQGISFIPPTWGDEALRGEFRERCKQWRTFQ